MTNYEHLERARLLLADWTDTVAVLLRCGHNERSAAEGAALLLADRLQLGTVQVEGVNR
jgi:hypothetical protein